MKIRDPIAAVVVCFVLSIITTTLRFWIRGVPLKRLMASEYVILLSQFLQCFVVGVSIYNFVLIDRKSTPLSNIAITIYTGYFLYSASLWCIKTSMCLLYLRLTRSSKLYWLAVALTTYVAVCGIVVLSLQLFTCWPIRRRFDPTDVCFSSRTHGLIWYTFTLNVSSEIFLVALPIPLMRQITFPPLKLALAVVFAMGLCVVIVDCVSVVLIYLNAEANGPIIVVLANIEVAVSMIISSLPGLSRAFMRQQQKRSAKQPFVLPRLETLPGVSKSQGIDTTIIESRSCNPRGTSIDLTDCPSLEDIGHLA